MRVLCDVHLSIKLTKHLVRCGIEALHVNQLPQKSETSDAEIVKFADANDFVVFTKDEDFRNSYLLRRAPQKLVHIRTGNQLKDQQLIELIDSRLLEIKRLNLLNTFYMEMTVDKMTVIIGA